MAGVTDSATPLDGVTVLDLATFLAAPVCATFLGEFGADVVKVEQPGVGDDLRRLGPSAGGSGSSYWWFVEARNKRSITCNLRDPEGQALIRRLVASTAVVTENFRPGTLERWNLGWAELSRVRPALVMLRISAFGQTGPHRARPGFGRIAAAVGGLAYLSGYPDRPPVSPGTPTVPDYLAGVFGALGALLALRHGERGAPQPLSEPRRAVGGDRLHQRPHVRAAPPGARPAGAQGRCAHGLGERPPRASRARGWARGRMGRGARRCGGALRPRGGRGPVVARRERARSLRGPAGARAREHPLPRGAVGRPSRDAGGGPAAHADARSRRACGADHTRRAQRGNLRRAARALASRPRAPARARRHLTMPVSARSLSVATTRFDRLFKTSMVSCGRFRMSHSSRSSLMMRSSVSLVA